MAVMTEQPCTDHGFHPEVLACPPFEVPYSHVGLIPHAFNIWFIFLGTASFTFPPDVQHCVSSFHFKGKSRISLCPCCSQATVEKDIKGGSRVSVSVLSETVLRGREGKTFQKEFSSVAWASGLRISGTRTKADHDS